MKGLRLARAIVIAVLVSAAAFVPSAQAAPPRSATPIVTNGAWTVYHHDDAHTGYDSTLSAVTGASAGWVSGALDGTVYAEPLVYQGIVYVATLNNTVYALNQSDGSVVWSNHIRAPETGGWSCGNFSSQGIVGTPVIDTAGGRIYVVTLDTTDDLYRIEGLNLATGVVELSTVITTMAQSGFDWTIEQQRGALAVHSGTVYIPFGGRAGDCGAYHGYLFSLNIATGAIGAPYITPGQGAGFWTAGGVVVDDSTGKVFETSGNGTSSGCNANADGTPVYENDAVVRLSAALAHEDAFIPQDWRSSWCTNDEDLGSASMVLINPTLAFQSGKWGTGFLVNPQSLGGLDGQLFPTPKPAAYSEVDVCFGSHHDANFGSYAYAAPYVYVSCEHNSRDNIRGGLVALQVDTVAHTFSSCDATCGAPSWHTADITFGPPIVAGGAVWAVDTGGSGLYGFNATTGAQIYHSAGFGVTHFTTPTEAGGQIFVGSGSFVRSFTTVSGCSSVTLSAAPPSSATAHSTVVLTAAASGANCVSPQYQYWMRPATGSWTMLADYSGANTYNWTSTTPPGAYYLGVHAKALGSPSAYESLASIPYTLTGTACTGVTLSAAPASPRPSGTQVAFTAGSTCPTANPLYEFWARWQGYTTWQLLQSYSTSNVYNWNSTGAAAGTEYFGVWVKDAGSSTSSFDANLSITYSVTTPACGSATVSANPTTVTHGTGTHVIVTGMASGCTNTSPLYEFWLRTTTTGWQLVQGYSTSATYDWNSTGAPVTTVYIGVWVKDAASSTSSFDANASVAIPVT